MDLNHDKQIQSLLCYRYTIGHGEALCKLNGLSCQSSRQSTVLKGRSHLDTTTRTRRVALPLPSDGRAPGVRGEASLGIRSRESQRCPTPHPNPLPSEGRGKSHHASSMSVVVSGCAPKGPSTIAHGFNRGLERPKSHKPRRGGRVAAIVVSDPCGTRLHDHVDPRMKSWAIPGRSIGASSFTHHVLRA